MNVNVVTVKSGWILQKIAERIAKAGNEASLGNFDVAHHPRIGADVNFYCDVQNCFRGPTNAVDIGLFTHVHANEIGNVNPITYKLDYIFHMSRKYMYMFKKHKLYPANRMDIMVPWEIPENFPLKKPTIGIFQRGKYEGKGFGRMKTLFTSSSEFCRYFKWLFVGNDWDEVIELGLGLGIDMLEYRDSKVSYPDGYSTLYDSCDYVLIPSKWEGGPICALEATAKGIPLISADVGWVFDLCPKSEIFKDTGGLKRIIWEMAQNLKRGRESVKTQRVEGEEISYEQCARQIVEVAENL